MGDLVAGVDLFLGQHAVDRQFFYPGPDLLFESADPLHEELVKIGANHGDKKDPFQQRHLVICRFVKYPLIEAQPGQLPVQIPFVTVQIERG